MNARLIFDYINDNLQTLEIDQIKVLIQPLINGLSLNTPVFPTGVFFYRARKLDDDFNKINGIKYDDLIHPPSPLCQDSCRLC